ncbi:ClbS/DfsB family four-helix bundle protein [Vibrio maritimus]|uniref:ClbS/DfsB family four-helix bundle protein n=1 Tax=Vibrio maritimus TaxID=990268 RepID=UPI004067CDF6
MSSVPKNKEELESAINTVFSKLMADYREIPENLCREAGIEGNIKGTVISVSDTVAYLIGWGQLVLKWHRLKSKGQHVDFPETGYKWNELGLLADSFHRKYRDWEYENLLTELESTTNQVLTLVSSLENRDLYEVEWYEQWTLGRMIQFNTSSPMKNMRTKVRRFKREFT